MRREIPSWPPRGSRGDRRGKGEAFGGVDEADERVVELAARHFDLGLELVEALRGGCLRARERRGQVGWKGVEALRAGARPRGRGAPDAPCREPRRRALPTAR